MRTDRKAGARLFAAGDRAEALYFVRTGEILLTREDEAPCALRGAGSIVGLEALVGGRYQRGAVCPTGAELCVLPQPRLLAWVGGSIPAARSLLETAVEELLRVGNESANGELSCEARLAAFLLKRHRGGVKEPLPKGTIAGLLGMRAETLSRCIGKLAEAGAVGSRLEVLDAGMLADVVRWGRIP